MSLKECASSQLPKGENLTKNRGQIFFQDKMSFPKLNTYKPFDVSKISIKYKTVENNYENEKEMINLTFSKRFPVIPAPQKSRISNPL